MIGIEEKSARLTTLEEIFARLLKIAEGESGDAELHTYAERIFEQLSDEKARKGKPVFGLYGRAACDMLRMLPPLDAEPSKTIPLIETRKFLWAKQSEVLEHTRFSDIPPEIVDEILLMQLETEIPEGELRDAFATITREGFEKTPVHTLWRLAQLSDEDSRGEVVRRAARAAGGSGSSSSFRLAAGILDAISTQTSSLRDYDPVVPDLIRDPCRAFAVKAAEVGCAASDLRGAMTGVHLGMPDGRTCKRPYPPSSKWLGWGIKMSPQADRVIYWAKLRNCYARIDDVVAYAREHFIDPALVAAKARKESGASPIFAVDVVVDVMPDNWKLGMPDEPVRTIKKTVE